MGAAGVSTCRGGQRGVGPCESTSGTGPALGAGGFFGVIAVVVAQCSPPPPTDATTTTIPVAVTAPVSVPIESAPTTAAPIIVASTTVVIDPTTTTTTPSTTTSTTSTTVPVSTTTLAPTTTSTTIAPPPPSTPPPTVAAEPPPPPTEATTTTVPATAVSDAVALANEQRAAVDLPPLAESGALVEAARSHSIDQATMQQMTHTGSDGSSLADRVARTGFAAGSLGENVAAGPSDASSAIDGWMGSTDHRDAILSPDYTSVGVASAQAGDGTVYWTMVLAG